MNLLVKVIAPIVVVLASLGSLFFVSKLSETKLAQRKEIAETKQTLDRTEQKLVATETTVEQQKQALLVKDGEVAQARVDLTKAKEETKTAQDLAEQRMQEVQTAQAQTAEKVKEIEGLTTKLTTTEQKVAELEKLAEKVQDLAKLEEIKKQATALGEENKELGRQLGEIRTQNASLKTQLEDAITTPVNVRGQVASIQDRWGFVVLNVGQQHKVRPETEFMVYRDSKLVCKVQIVSVGQNTSIAEVLPDFQRSYPRVGDQVLR